MAAKRSNKHEPRWRELIRAHPRLLGHPPIRAAMGRDGINPDQLTRRGGARFRPQREVRDELHVSRGGSNSEEAEAWNRDRDAMFHAGRTGSELLTSSSLERKKREFEMFRRQMGRLSEANAAAQDDSSARASEHIAMLRALAYDELVAAVSAERCSFVVCTRVPWWAAAAQVRDGGRPRDMRLVQGGATVHRPRALLIRTKGSRRREYLILVPPTHRAASDDASSDELRWRLRWELTADLLEPAVDGDEIRRRRWRWQQRTHWMS